MEALEAMFRSGELEVVSLDRDALTWVFDFMRKCRSAGAQLADATVIHIAERMGIDFVFTLDLRDFSIYPFADGRAPSIIPKP
jgi:predicted nucleic acid-binding protein